MTKQEPDDFISKERKRQCKLLVTNSPVFYGAHANGYFINKCGQKETRMFLITNEESAKNLYSKIQISCIEYCRENGIALWQDDVNDGMIITNHILSSQVACFNHLFFIHSDKKATLAVAKAISRIDLDDVMIIPYDKGVNYISFEVIGNKDYLGEVEGNVNRTRGTKCTSIDAFIIGVKDGRKVLIPIEWKYTESYDDKDLSSGKAGKIRLSRKYEELRKVYLNEPFNRSFFYTEPFYQLMRQTLLTEEMIHFNEIDGAKDYVHVHVVPKENKTLLPKHYPYTNGLNMVDVWSKCLKHPSKYKCVDPSFIVDAIEHSGSKTDYSDLVNYLRTRYNYK